MHSDDNELSAHRTRSNRRPEPQPHLELVQAVEAVYSGLVEDES